MDTLGFFKYHSLQCDEHTADVIFQGTAIGINYNMAKRNIPVNRFFWPCLGKFRILHMCFSICFNSSLDDLLLLQSSQLLISDRSRLTRNNSYLISTAALAPSAPVLITSSLLTSVELVTLPGDKFVPEMLQIISEKVNHEFWGHFPYKIHSDIILFKIQKQLKF